MYSTTMATTLTLLVGSPAPEEHPAWSPDGSMIVFDAMHDNIYDLWIFTVNDLSLRQLVRIPGHLLYPTWSPDGRTIAFSISQRIEGQEGQKDQDTWNIGMVSSDGLGKIFIPILEAAHDLFPVWSPDGTRLAFGKVQDLQEMDLIISSAFGVGKQTAITDWDGEEQVPAWSPDGRYLAFHANRSGNIDLWVIDLQGIEAPRQMTFDNAEDGQPSWSPSGRRLAFASNRDGKFDIWVVDFPRIEDPIQITSDLADEWWPCWSPDGRSIVFQSKKAGNYDIWLATDLPEAARDSLDVRPTDSLRHTTWGSLKQ